MKRLDASGILQLSDDWIPIRAESGFILCYYHPNRHEIRVIKRNGRMLSGMLPQTTPIRDAPEDARNDDRGRSLV